MSYQEPNPLIDTPGVNELAPVPETDTAAPSSWTPTALAQPGTDPLAGYGTPTSPGEYEAAWNVAQVHALRPGEVHPRNVIEHHHEVETTERGTERVTARTVRVVGNTVEHVLLTRNPNRKRAIIKVVTSASAVILGAGQQGGNPQFTAAPAGPSAFYYQATGDPLLTVETGAEVVAYGTLVAGAVDVSVWEEIYDPENAPAGGPTR